MLIEEFQVLDEASVICNIAKNIPFGSFLYVKEHPSAVGLNDKRFYRLLSYVPNVILVSHKYCTKNLIKKSIGIITLTGTVGFEALLMGKPVYVLGETEYLFHPNAFKLNSFSDIPDMLKKPYTSGLELDRVNEIFICILKGSLHKGDLNSFRNLDIVEDVVNSVIEKISI